MLAADLAAGIGITAGDGVTEDAVGKAGSGIATGSGAAVGADGKGGGIAGALLQYFGASPILLKE